MKTFRLLLIFSVAILSFTSCGTSKNHYYASSNISKASTKLGVNINRNDNLSLYFEASDWLGTPYRSGGQSRNGVDCSGFVNVMYRNVYNKKISRSSADMLKNDCYKIRKSKLKEGDLIFSKTGNSRKINHVGIYLKNGKFIHAATRGGVRVDNLNDAYYKKTYTAAGRVGVFR